MRTPKEFREFLKDFAEKRKYKRFRIVEEDKNFFILFNSSREDKELFQFKNKEEFKSFVLGVITAMKIYKK